MAARKPAMKVEHKEYRLLVATEFRDWGVDRWGRVIFSDESSFSTKFSQRHKVWRLRKHRYDPQNVVSVAQSGRVSVSVWGCISSTGLGPLYRIQGHLNSPGYINILSEVLLPYATQTFGEAYVFQHDRASIHTAAIVDEFLEGRNVAVFPWPSKGADLNPIENVWGFLKRNISLHPPALANADALWELIHNTWENLRVHQTLIPSLYESMPHRMAKVIAARGEAINY